MSPSLFTSNAITSRSELLRWSGWFLFLNTVLLLLVSTRYLSNMDWPETLLAQLHTGLAFVGHFITVAMAPMLLLGLVILLYPQKKLLSILAVLLSSFVLLLIVVDSIIFELYRFHLNGMVWSLLVNGGITEILPISWLTWLISLLVIVAIVALETFIAMQLWSRLKNWKFSGRKVALLSLLVIISAQTLHAWADANNITEVTKQVRYLPGYRPLTAKRMMRNLGLAHASEQLNLQVKRSSSNLHYPTQALQCSADNPNMNVLMVVLDSWRFDMMSEAVTPNIWAFSHNASNFQQHISSGNATRFGIFGMFYGLHGTYWHSVLAEEKGPVLIDELKQRDYEFALFASARMNSPEFDRTVFSAVRDRLGDHTSGATVWQRDENITENFLRFLDHREEQQPFFGFLFYDAPHGYSYPATAEAPFQPIWETVNHLELDDNFDPVPYRNRYKNAVHYDDFLLGKVLKKLHDEGTLNNTIVIITGDHGEEFNENGGNYWGHNNAYSPQQVQVPMIVHWPGKAAQRFTHTTSHLDIAPTLLREMLDCAAPSQAYSNGLNLFDQQARDFLLVSSWDRFAILGQNRVDLIYDAGFSESYEKPFKANSNLPPLQAKIMLDVMEETSRFYAK